MTKQVGNHGLFCLDETDYAAFALAMECNAQTIDSVLTDQQDSLNSFLDRAYISATNPAAVVFSSGSGQIGPENVLGDSLQPFGTSVTAVNGITPNSITGWPLGFYLVGTSINWTVATPNNNTRRLLMAFGLNNVNGVVNVNSTYSDLYLSTDYEGSTGGTGALTTVGMVENTGNMVNVAAFFSHSNTSSTINVAAGQWKIWAIHLGVGTDF